MKKHLLNEATTRRFMKLANIGNLSENFLSSVEEDLYQEEELPPEEEPGLEGGPPEPEMGDLGDLEGDLDAEPELGGDEAPGGNTVEVDVEALVDRLAAAITDETGVPVERDGAPEGGGEELEEPMPGEEEEADMAPSPEPPEEEEGGLGTLEEDDASAVVSEDEIDEQLKAANITLENDDVQEDLVNEVTRRVARRLLSAVGK